MADERQAAQACMLCVRPALLWCATATATDHAAFAAFVTQQAAFVASMHSLLATHPGLGKNYCCHPL